MADLTDWIAAAQSRGAVIVGKRLSANDTGATGAHQVGPYVTRSVVDEIFGDMLLRASEDNPKELVRTSFASHNLPTHDVTLTWYNNQLRGLTRNEFRLTGWGGRSSPIQDAKNTGSLCLFGFVPGTDGKASCDIWMCQTATEEDVAEAALGAVEPGEMLVLYSPSSTQSAVQHTLESVLIPQAWHGEFPTAQDLVAESVRRVPDGRDSIDRILVRRREAEYDLFRQVEDSVALPRIKEGFTSLDDFIQFAGSLTNRRKARSGRSLELQLVEIFGREGLRFAHGPVIEGGKRPDFLFPSVESYDDSAFPAEQLTMLAVKTTCKDRWRQILNEASRVPRKHLLTLQEGVSEGQFAEMAEANVALVVPQPLHDRFPKSVRAHLLTLQDFVTHVHSLEK